MWQRLMLFSLTPIILHPVCQLQCAGWRRKNYLWQWPEASVELCSWAPVIRPSWMCAGVWVRKCVEVHGELYQLFLIKVKVYRVSICVPILRRSRVTEHSVEAFWSSQVCTSPVTTAEWQKGANGCCYAWLPEHLLRVTLLFHCHLAPSDSTGKSALLFPSLPPNLHLIDAILCHQLINDLCSRRCELLHFNQSQWNYGILLSSWTTLINSLNPTL